jgi:reactive intermediate/imine deaminase
MRSALPYTRLLLAFCAFLLSAPGAMSSNQAKHYQSDAMAKLNLPFSEAVIVGDLLFLSGQLGNKPGTAQLAPGGIAAETRQAIDNIGAVLQANGSSFDRIIRCTVFLADIKEWPAFNEVYAGYFEPPYPARSAAAVSGLALGARVEIECIAYR